MRVWFRIENAASDPTLAEIHIIDWIGDWIDEWIKQAWGDTSPVTAKSFIDELAKLPESVRSIHVHINSPGGDVQGGINIANALREQQSKGRTVETFVDGIAASIASVIAMAGSKVHMGDNALLMVHEPWTVAIGNAREMRKTADVLDTVRGQIVATYKWHSDQSDEALIALMEAETWLNADEAIAAGLATDKVEGLQAAAALDARLLAKMSVPEKYRARVDALVAPPRPTTGATAAPAADVLRLCREGGVLDLAEELVAAGAPMADATARIAAEKATRAAAQARATEITAICVKAKLPELAAGYIKGAMAVDDVRAQLTVLTAKLDGIEIDGSLPADQGGRAVPQLSAAAIYHERNRLTSPKKEN